MTISLTALRDLAGPFEILVHSMEGALYSVRVRIDGAEQRVLDDDGNTLGGRSLEQVRQQLAGVNVDSIMLQQVSAYDEMVGHAAREGENTLQVRVSVSHE